MCVRGAVVAVSALFAMCSDQKWESRRDRVALLTFGIQLRPYFGVAKVGLELYSATGPEVIGSLAELGFEVFLDLKLHDIPTTVGKAARVLGAVGVNYVTLHAHGGPAMLQAGVEGLREGAAH